MQGRFARVEVLDADRHGEDLFAANRLDAAGRNWTYLNIGPFERFEDYRAWLDRVCGKSDPMFHAVVDLATEKAVGVAAYMRIELAHGCIEVGSINYSPLLQRKPAGTEAMYLMMARVFDELGYRRYEWKCDTLNAPSRAAAARLGFTHEGLFRQAVVNKGRNRDTDWFSIIDSEWPALKAAYEQWLAPGNFDAGGRQRRLLAELIAAERARAPRLDQPTDIPI
ncbi:MAG TPA: GNAT family protein [Hyphomicrobiaceae bacterium]|nr:GNAT family protein [Hyphomicrobiaceae bacterium]